MEESSEKSNSTLVYGGTSTRPEIVNKKPGKIILYPITKYELDALRSTGIGNKAESVFYGTLGIAASFFIAYTTCGFRAVYQELIFLFTSILATIICIASLIIWLKTNKKSNRLYNEIVSREDES